MKGMSEKSVVAYECFKIIVKVAGLGVGIEEMQHVFILNQDLGIKNSLVRKSITHYSVWIRVKL